MKLAEYVDRDLLKEKLFRAIGASPDGNCGNCECDERECMFIKCFTRMDVCEKIEDELLAAPTADLRPVVRGKWIGNKRHQSCSKCHMTYCVPDGQDGELDMTAYHFCPNCGADMREES